jgi:hypothetical protein
MHTRIRWGVGSWRGDSDGPSCAWYQTALLADVCPTCGNYQRQQQVYRRVPTPALCACGESLGAVHTVKLTADHAIVQAQRQVFDVINNGATSFGVFEANRNSVRDVLAATRSLAAAESANLRSRGSGGPGDRY